MKWLALWIVRFYPQWWRQRYETEMLALVDDLSLRPADLLDLLFGMWDVHINLTPSHKEDVMFNNRYTFTGITLLLLAVAILVALFVPFISEDQSELLLFAAPMLSLLAARALHTRWRDTAPRAAQRLVGAAYILLGVLVALFVYGSITALVFESAMPPLIGLVWLLATVGFVTWTIAAARLSLQTDALHSALCGVGFLVAAAYVGMLFLLFVNPGSLVSNAVVTLFVIINLAWLLGLAQTALTHPTHLNPSS